MKCKRCNEEFEIRPGFKNFCSKKCQSYIPITDDYRAKLSASQLNSEKAKARNEKMKGVWLKPHIETKCAFCEKSIFQLATQWQKKCCSKECRTALAVKRRSERIERRKANKVERVLKQTICLECGKTEEILPSTFKKKFCSTECRKVFIEKRHSEKNAVKLSNREARLKELKERVKPIRVIAKVEVNCTVCNDTYLAIKGGYQKKYCSNQCRFNQNSNQKSIAVRAPKVLKEKVVKTPMQKTVKPKMKKDKFDFTDDRPFSKRFTKEDYEKLVDSLKNIDKTYTTKSQNIKQYNCKSCNNIIEDVRTRTYCNKKCQDDVLRFKPKEIECAGCGTKFFTTSKRSRFCTVSCSKKSFNKQNNGLYYRKVVAVPPTPKTSHLGHEERKFLKRARRIQKNIIMEEFETCKALHKYDLNNGVEETINDAEVYTIKQGLKENYIKTKREIAQDYVNAKMEVPDWLNIDLVSEEELNRIADEHFEFMKGFLFFKPSENDFS